MATTAEYLNALMRDKKAYVNKISNLLEEPVNENLTFSELNEIYYRALCKQTMNQIGNTLLRYFTSNGADSLENFKSISEEQRQILNVRFTSGDLSYLGSSLNVLQSAEGLEQFNSQYLSNLSHLFSQCYNLNNIDALSTWNTSNVKDINYLLYHTNLNNIEAIKNWDTSKVENMGSFLSSTEIKNFNPLVNWNTSNVRNIQYAFQGLGNNKQAVDLSMLAKWDTRNFTNICRILGNTYATDFNFLSNWKMNNVVDMSGAFDTNAITNLDFALNWNVSNVVNMAAALPSTNLITNIQPLANWDVSNVINMSGLFANTGITNLNALKNWKMNNVTEIGGLFSGCKNLTDVSGIQNWNTGKINCMWNLFLGCTNLKTVNIRGWNLDSSRYTPDFTGCTNLTTVDVTGLNVKNIYSGYQMFANCTNLTTVIGLDTWNLSNWGDAQQMFRYCNNLSTSTVEGIAKMLLTGTKMTSTYKNLRYSNSYGPGYNSTLGNIINNTFPNLANDLINNGWVF